MNHLICYSAVILAVLSAQVLCAARVEVQVKVDSYPAQAEPEQENKVIPRYAVTEPAWVTELLGPTEAPVTTKRPSLPDRIRNTISTGLAQVSNTISGIPNRITQIIQGIQTGAQNIIRRPTTTSKPDAGAAVVPSADTAGKPTVAPTVTSAPTVKSA